MRKKIILPASIIVAIIMAIGTIIVAMINRTPGPPPPPCDKMRELLIDGNNFLKSEDISRKDFESWKNKCEGVLKKSSPDLKEDLIKIEEDHLLFDFYSQTRAINELLESEIAKCK